MVIVAMQQNLIYTSKLARLIKKRYFDKNGYSLRERINQNSEVMALIGQYSASLRIMRALAFRPALATSSALVT